MPAAADASNNAADYELGGPSGPPPAGAPLDTEDREPSVQLLPGGLDGAGAWGLSWGSEGGGR